jgi:hypothetical protein
MATSTATADYAAGELGWFFTGTGSVTVEKDRDHHVTVAMRQQVRGLTLELEITGDAKDLVTGVGATLSGVAGTIDIETGNPAGNAVTVAPVFVKTDGKYMATIRLLGVTGNAQPLALTLQFASGNPSTYTVASDLSSPFAAFNDDRKTPLTLRSILVVTPTQAGFTATIDPWTENGSVIAD